MYIYVHTHIRHGEVRCTPLDFPGFSQGCGRALNRVEGGRRVRLEGRTAARERMVVGEKDEEIVWGRRDRERERKREVAREGETIMSGAREGERNKKRGRRW